MCENIHVGRTFLPLSRKRFHLHSATSSHAVLAMMLWMMSVAVGVNNYQVNQNDAVFMGMMNMEGHGDVFPFNAGEVKALTTKKK